MLINNINFLKTHLYELIGEEMLVMKRFIKIGAFVAVACMFCFVLTGCKAATVDGNWEVSGGKSNGAELNQETLEQLNKWGMPLILIVSEDGTCQLDHFGTVSDGKWTQNDDGTYNFDINNSDESALTGKISGNTLTIKSDELDIQMKKGGDDLVTQVQNDRAENAESDK